MRTGGKRAVDSFGQNSRTVDSFRQSGTSVRGEKLQLAYISVNLLHSLKFLRRQQSKFELFSVKNESLHDIVDFFTEVTSKSKLLPRNQQYHK